MNSYEQNPNVDEIWRKHYLAKLPLSDEEKIVLIDHFGVHLPGYAATLAIELNMPERAKQLEQKSRKFFETRDLESSLE